MDLISWKELILQTDPTIWSLPSVLQFQNFKGPHSFVIHLISMYSTIFSRNFLSFLNFPEMKEREHNFLRGTNSAKCLHYLLSRSVYQFKKLKGPNFFVNHFISMHSASFSINFLSFLKFLEFKERGPNFLQGTNFAEGLNYLVLHSVFQF